MVKVQLKYRTSIDAARRAKTLAGRALQVNTRFHLPHNSVLKMQSVAVNSQNDGLMKKPSVARGLFKPSFCPAN